MRSSAVVGLLGLLALPHAATARAEPSLAAPAGRSPQLQRIAEAQAAAAALPSAPEPAALREIEERFISALELEPGNRPARAAVAVFYRAHGEQQAPPSKALLELIARDADPAGLALSLVCPADEGAGSILDQSILLAALRRQPQQPVLWYELARRVSEPAARAAYLAEATARADALGSRGAEAARVLVAARLHELLGLGLFEEALSLGAGLSSDLRRDVEEKPVPSASLDVLGLRLATPAYDLRLGLAVAEAAVGDPRRAAALVAGLPWHLRLGSSVTPSAATVTAALVHCAIGDVPGDPFRFVSTALTLPASGEDGALDSAAGWRLIAAIARRRGELHLEAFALDRLRSWWPPCEGCEAELDGAQGMFPATAGLARALRAELDRKAREADDTRVALLEELDSQDRVARGIARRAAKPSVFSSVALPWDEIEETEGAEDQLAETTEDAPDNVLRVDPADPRPGGRPRAAVVRREEVDSADYWLELDRTTGTSETVFTGLPTRRYDVLPRSPLPLLDGDSVQIAALDFDAAETGETDVLPGRVLLRATLAALRADSDGDGLTDVIEARWLTDPQRADTDGDGLDDAVDPSPLVPGGRVSPLGEPLALALAELVGTTTEILAASHTPICCHTLDLPTDIVVAPRTLLAGIGGAARLVVLAPLEHAALPASLQSGALVLGLIYFDDAVEHGIVEWWSDANGGTLRLDRRADGWHVTRLGDWVS